jgi:DNA-binding transcriptional LysR family regulator
MVDLHADDLIYLLELVRTGRLVDAARRLGVEHTTVSRRIAALEKSVGRRLVHRTPRGWRLTDDGEDLLRHAEAVESALHAVERIGVGARSSLGGTVRIAAPDGIGSTVVPDALVGLQLAHPQLEVELTTATRRFDIMSRDYDVAITMERARSRRLVVRHFTDYRMGLYATAEYLATHPPVHRREDLAAHALVWYVESLLEVAELDIFESHVVSARPVLRSSNVLAQLRFVTSHGGIGFLPRFLVMNRGDLVPVLPDEVSARRTMWLVVRSDSFGLARVAATVDALLAHVAEIQDRLGITATG